MSVSNLSYLQGIYNTKAALGAPSISSDATFEIEGFEALHLLTKQFPWPTVGSAGEVEQPLPMGLTSFVPQQAKIAQQGPITFSETANGAVMTFMQQIVNAGGVFNGTVYEGTPDRFIRAMRLRNCFFVPDQPDRDFENRSQVLLISGTLFFHFFGETLPGNVKAG